MNNTLTSAKNRDFIAEAQALGSTAATRKGAIQYLIRKIKNTPDQRKRDKLRPAFNGFVALTQRIEWQRGDRYYYHREISARKADPDAKAARDGYRREKYLRTLRAREMAALTIKNSGDVDAVSAAWDNRKKRQTELNEVARLRSIVYGRTVSPKTFKMPDTVRTVGIDSDTAAAVGYPPIRRGKNWSVYSTYGHSRRETTEGCTEWKNGRPVSYTRAINDTYVRSFAIRRSERTLSGVCHTTPYTVELPEGFAWDSCDQDGLRAYKKDSPRDDYHPNAGELMEPDAGQKIADKLEANRVTRLETAARQAAELAEMEGVWIGVDDSVRAGNCRQGTLVFAERHGLNPARHYRAMEILKIENGDAGRVRLAITAAVIRHRREMNAGMCIL